MVQKGFSPDLYKVLFEGSKDAQAIVDPNNYLFLDINHSFEDLSGYTRGELIDAKKPISALIPPDNLHLFAERSKGPFKCELRMARKDGTMLPVELSLCPLTFDGNDITLATLRDLTPHKRVEQEMWAKIQELSQANTRIYSLTEKIKLVPELIPRLLYIATEEELLETLAQFLCERRGLGFQNVSLYLFKKDHLELSYSTFAGKKRRKLPTDHKLTKVLLGIQSPHVTDRMGILPLKGREGKIGILEIFFDPQETKEIQTNLQARKSFQDVMITLAEIIGLVIENLQLYETVRLQSIMDQLTGVYNRRYFELKFKEEFSRSVRYRHDLALIITDLDLFKKINDTYGHDQGDSVLVEVARILKSTCREVDIVCRLGGDEFTITTPETHAIGGVIKAEHIRKMIKEHKFLNLSDGKHNIRSTVSIGVAIYHPSMKSEQEMFKVADKALYLAKQEGRDMVRILSKGEVK
jgi:diguanylate cyclase (GGDEF)-like protein/PAS domain S-box-containing protein